MYCRACARAQGEALQQVESLLARLEVAESLYPSSHAFGASYPLYKSPEFTDRVKAMCLWYNMTKHHRFKLQILGRLLMMLHSKKKQDDFTDSGIRYLDFETTLFWQYFRIVLELSYLYSYFVPFAMFEKEDTFKISFNVCVQKLQSYVIDCFYS